MPPWTFEVMLEKICWQIFPKKHFLSPASRQWHPSAHFEHLGTLWPVRIIFSFLGGPRPCWGPESDKKAPKGHQKRCVPGTSQASAEAENDEVAIFSGACGQLSLCWSGGCAAPPTGYFFSCERGGPAGPLCPLSVTPAGRKNPKFHVFSRLVLAKQRLARAQRKQLLRCARTHHRCSRRRSLCAKSSILRAWVPGISFGALACTLTLKPGVPPLEEPSGAIWEGPGAARRTEQDAFLAHPRQVRRLKLMK